MATAIAAIGTVAAVLVALFYQPTREAQQKPHLSLGEPDFPGWEFPTDLGGLHTVTLPVIAETGRKSAEEVEVLATAKWRSKASRPEERWHIVFENRPLPWFESDDVDGKQIGMHMPPGISRRVEILKIGAPSALHEWLGWSSVSDWPAFDEPVAFAVLPKPPSINSEPFASGHLHWHLTLKVAARDVDTVTYESDLEVLVERIERPESDFPTPEVAETEASRISVEVNWIDFRRTSRS